MKSFVKYFLWFVVLLVVLFSYVLNKKFLGSLNPSEEEKVKACYVFPEWEDLSCLFGGRKVREVTIKEPKCSFLDEIKRPTGVTTCNFVPCSFDDLIIEDWGSCVDGIQKRIIRPNNNTCGVNTESFPIERSCKNISKVQRVTLLKSYETQIDTSLTNPYKVNNDNLALNINGSLKSAKLVISNPKTYVLGGESFNIPADYYFMLSMGEDFPRALNLKRTDLGNGNTKLESVDGGQGIFKGTELPSSVEVDLADFIFARSSIESPFGYFNKDYISLLNQQDNQNLSMTLYMADGRSMTEPDKYSRVFGSIDAYIDYECKDEAICSIEVLQN